MKMVLYLCGLPPKNLYKSGIIIRKDQTNSNRGAPNLIPDWHFSKLSKSTKRRRIKETVTAKSSLRRQLHVMWMGSWNSKRTLGKKLRKSEGAIDFS